MTTMETLVAAIGKGNWADARDADSTIKIISEALAAAGCTPEDRDARCTQAAFTHKPTLIVSCKGELVAVMVRFNANENQGRLDVERLRDYRKAYKWPLGLLVSVSAKGSTFTTGLRDEMMGPWKDDYLNEIVVNTSKPPIKVSWLRFDHKGRQHRVNL